MTGSGTVAARIEQLTRTLAQAQSDAAAGRPLELAAFGTELRALCRHIEAQPRDEAERYGPALLDLRDRLVQLAATVQRQLQDFAEALGQGGAPAAAEPLEGAE